VLRIFGKALDIAKISMLIVGAIVGAGFSSGRELSQMFVGRGAASWYTVVLVAAIIAGVSMLIMLLARKIKPNNIGQFHSVVFGRFSVIVDIFVLLNCFIVLAAMIAGLSGVGGDIGIIGLALVPIACMIAVIIVVKGIRSLVKVNLVLIPVVIVILLVVSIPAAIGGSVLGGRLGIFPALLYAGMNMTLALGVFIKVRDLSTQVIVVSSIVAGVIVGGLIYIILSAIAANPDSAHAPLPILLFARQGSALVWAIRVSMILSIITSIVVLLQTLTDWLQTIVKHRLIAALIIIVAAFVLSLVGFVNIVAWFYPIAGVLGIIYLAWCVCYFVLSKRSGRKPPKKPVIEPG